MDPHQTSQGRPHNIVGSIWSHFIANTTHYKLTTKKHY
jgi:hypothetical protein